MQTFNVYKYSNYIFHIKEGTSMDNKSNTIQFSLIKTIDKNNEFNSKQIKIRCQQNVYKH